MKIEFASSESPYTELAVICEGNHQRTVTLEEAFAIYQAHKDGEGVELSYALTTRLRWQELELEYLMCR